MPENHAGSKLDRPVTAALFRAIVFISAGYTAPSGKKQA